MPTEPFAQLIAEIRGCALCAAELPLGPRPVVFGLPMARLLIISQAPGIRVHETGLSFNDRSGDRLREWLGIDREVFYDETRVAVMGMAFCYPGTDPGGGDLPPARRCAPFWHPRLRPHYADVRLTLLVGSYAIRHYLPRGRSEPIGAILHRWHDFLPDFFVLPHPSWRTIHWQRSNPWFEAELLADLRQRVRTLLSSG